MKRTLCFFWVSMLLSIPAFAETSARIDLYSFDAGNGVRVTDALLFVGQADPVLIASSKDESAVLNRKYFGWFTLGVNAYCVVANGADFYLLSVKNGYNLVPNSDYARINAKYKQPSDSDNQVKVTKIRGALATNATLVDGEYHEAKAAYFRDLALSDTKFHGIDVWCLQRLLQLQGYSEVGTVDGWFGKMTEKALLRFQKDHDLAMDGAVTQDTWDALSGEYEPALGD